MGKVRLDISMSLDGYVAGPNARLEAPLGENGDRLHEWVFGLKSFRATHGMGRAAPSIATTRSSRSRSPRPAP